MANTYDKPNYKLHGTIALIIAGIAIALLLSVPGWEWVAAVILLGDAVYAIISGVYDPSGPYRVSED